LKKSPKSFVSSYGKFLLLKISITFIFLILAIEFLVCEEHPSLRLVIFSILSGRNIFPKTKPSMKYRIAHVACTLLSVMDLAESQIRGAKENRELQNLDFMDQPPPVSAGKDCFKMNQQGRGPTCDPTPDPSFSPSLPPKLANEGLSTNPTTSPAPSKTFSGAPSQLPSDSPSEVPTELPSDSPSEVPTELPSDSPSEDPTASTSPSAVPTTSSQPSLSATPTLAPTLSSSPSLTASSSPSTVPTTSAAPTTSIQPSAENQLRFIADDDEVALPDHYLGKCEAGKRMARDANRELKAATNSTLISLSFSAVRSFSPRL
jgi:hypothetical protein